MLALSGVHTRLGDVDESALERASSAVRKNLDKGVEKGKVEQSLMEATLSRISVSTDLPSAAADAQLAIEAVPEQIELKRRGFAQVSEVMEAGALLATNTSSLPIGEIASAAKHPQRVVGMHFFNPVHIMKLVEVVRGEESSEEASDPLLSTSAPLFSWASRYVSRDILSASSEVMLSSCREIFFRYQFCALRPSGSLWKKSISQYGLYSCANSI